MKASGIADFWELTDSNRFLPRETRDYVKKVLRNYRNYRRLYGNTDGGGGPEGAE